MHCVIGQETRNRRETNEYSQPTSPPLREPDHPFRCSDRWVRVCLAHQLRFSFPELLPFGEVSPRDETLWLSILAMLIWPLVARIGGLYRSRRAEKNLGEAFQIVKTSLCALVALVMIAYFTRDHRYSRLTLLLWAGLTPCLVFSGRLVLRLVLSQLRRYGLNLRHIVVVGDGDSAKSVVDTILADTSLGLNIVGHVGDKPAHPEVPYLGTFDALPEVVQSHAPQQWILTLRPEKCRCFRNWLKSCSRPMRTLG